MRYLMNAKQETLTVADLGRRLVVAIVVGVLAGVATLAADLMLFG